VVKLRVATIDVHSNCTAATFYYLGLILLFDRLNIFEHAKITRWRYYNADNFNML